MLELLVFAISIVYIALCLKSIAYGCACMIAVKLLIPVIARVGPVSLNTFILIVLCFFIFIRNKHTLKDYWRRIAVFPFKYLALPLAVLGIAGVVPYINQIKGLVQFSVTELLPFLIMIYAIKNDKDIKMLTRVIVCSYIVIGIYSIFSYIIHFNPLILSFATAFNYEGEYFYDYSEESAVRGVLTSRATGNQTGSISWGQITLVLLAWGLLSPNMKKNLPDFKVLKAGGIRFLFVAIALVNAFMTTKRSTLVPVFFMIFVYIVRQGIKVKKIMCYSMIAFLLVGLCYSFSETFRDFYESNIKTSIFFWNDKLAEQQGLSGSNKEMRLHQVVYVNNLIENHFFMGLGYGYPEIHSQKYGNNSDALFFESLYLYAIASSGYIGLFIWLLFFYVNMKTTKKSFANPLYNYLFHGSYMLSVFLTNISLSLSYYMILSAFLARDRYINAKAL